MRLNEPLIAVAEPQEWYTISKRDFKTDDYKAGEGYVEAPFIFKKMVTTICLFLLITAARKLKSDYKVAKLR